VFSRWRQPPPPPPPFYRRQPIATIGIILTIVGMFILGPVGYLWNGMAEELKNVRSKIETVEKDKVDNENLKETLNELKEQRKDQAAADKDQNKSIQTNQMAIERILIRQELAPPKNISIGGKAEDTRTIKPVAKKKLTVRRTPKKMSKAVVGKKALPPDFFVKLDQIKDPEVKARYLRYLRHKGYDTEGLE